MIETIASAEFPPSFILSVFKRKNIPDIMITAVVIIIVCMQEFNV